MLQENGFPFFEKASSSTKIFSLYCLSSNSFRKKDENFIIHFINLILTNFLFLNMEFLKAPLFFMNNTKIEKPKER
jgi:hypothetical protein